MSINDHRCHRSAGCSSSGQAKTRRNAAACLRPDSPGVFLLLVLMLLALLAGGCVFCSAEVAVTSSANNAERRSDRGGGREGVVGSTGGRPPPAKRRDLHADAPPPSPGETGVRREGRRSAEGLLASSSAAARRHPPEDVVVTVSLWDDGGVLRDREGAAAESSPRSSGIPRYVIGKLAVVDAAAKKAPKPLKKSRHYFTFDLGNSRQSILVVEGCRGCDCPSAVVSSDLSDYSDAVGLSQSFSPLVNNANATERSPPPVDCCPSAVPAICGDIGIGGGDGGGDGDFCWPSHRDNYLPRESYRNAIDADCPRNVSRATGVVDGCNSTVCMQCFGCHSHSRFYTMAESDSLVLVGADGTPDGDRSVFILGDAFRFGALVRTAPNLDRVWSNVGLGYNSSFLKQTNISSFLLHLRPGEDGREEGGGEGKHRSGSHIVLNPSPGRYLRRRGVRVAPFELDGRHRRINPVDILVVGGSNGGHGGTQVRGADGGRTPFHMDTGNEGISLADEGMIWGLAAATGGKWKVHKEEGRVHREEGEMERPGDSNWNLNGYGSEEEREASMGGGRPGGACNVTARRLFVPFGPSDAPMLDVVLSPGIAVSLPGRAWVISRGGGTIFSTYHKNVLGLPFICADVDVVFDDVNRLLYIVRDDVNVQSNLTADMS